MQPPPACSAAARAQATNPFPVANAAPSPGPAAVVGIVKYISASPIYN